MPDFPSLMREMENPWTFCQHRGRFRTRKGAAVAPSAGCVGEENADKSGAGRQDFFFFFSLHFTRWRCSHSLITHPSWMISVFSMPSLSHTSDFKLHVYFNSCVGYPRVKLGHLFCIRLLNCEYVPKRFTSRLSANEIHASLKEPIRLSCYQVASPSSFDRSFRGNI